MLNLELFNNSLTKEYIGFKWASVIQSHTFTNLAANSLKFQYKLSPTALGTTAAAAATGWTNVETFVFNATTTQTFDSNGGKVFGGGTVWGPKTYLYVRWYDAAQAVNGRGLGINSVKITAVPEPATWVAAGLLLGCVGLGSRRRKASASAQLVA
jgi:hypothetical protein